MKKYAIAAVGLATCFGGAAHAQEAASRAFAGPHFGIAAVHDSNEASQTKGSAEKSRTGFGARGAIGLDLPVTDAVIVGAEFGIAKGGRTIDQPSQGGGRYRLTPGVNYDLTARLGWAVNPYLLIYAKAGYHWMEREEAIAGQAVGNGTTKGTFGGFTYGGGVEWNVAPQLALRAEMDHSAFSDRLRQTRLTMGPIFRF